MRRLGLFVAVLVVAGVAWPTVAFAAEPVEEQVNGNALRFGAQQITPDVSGSRVVWMDYRGTSTSDAPGASIWTKDLSSKSETRVTLLSTDQSFPRISGDWVVFEDFNGTDSDVFAHNLATGDPRVTVTPTAGNQVMPAIDGTKVVWVDDRDAGTNGTDIYTKDLSGGSESVLANSSNNESDPQVSGSTVVWTEEVAVNDFAVKARTGSGAPFTISDPASTATASNPSIDGTRIAWAESGANGDRVKTCTLPCSSSTEVASTTSQLAQTQPDVSGDRVAWIEGDDVGNTQVRFRDMGSGTAQTLEKGSQSTCTPLTCNSVAIDGTRTVFVADDFPGPETQDVRWRDTATGAPSIRVNSIGFGGYGNQVFPNAEGDFVTYLSPAPKNRVWATDLTGSRRDLRVSSYDDVGTFVSPPRISGTRVVWSDFRNNPSGSWPLQTSTDDPFQRVLSPLGPETRLSDTTGTGGPPDASGTRTAWVCDLTFVCSDVGGGVDTKQALPVSSGFTVDKQVRLDGDVVVWLEYVFVPDDAPSDSKIHAFKLGTGVDNVLGSGTASRPEHFPGFDIAGTNVVWVGRDGLYKNTTDFACSGGACDRSASAVNFRDNTSRFHQQISIDGTKVAYDEFGLDFNTVILRDDLASPSVVVVSDGTATGGFPIAPSIAGDYVYWQDGRNGNADIYRESISGTGATLGADAAAPGPVTGLAADFNSPTTVNVTWTNPGDADLVGVVLLRRLGTTAPVLDEGNAQVVFIGEGTSYLDTDVVEGQIYSYAAYAFDEVPNYSSRATARTQDLRQVSVNDVSATEGDSESTTFTFTLSLNAPSAFNVSVSFATANGTAVAGSDYTGTSGSRTFSPGTTSETVAVSLTGDSYDEPDETLVLNLSSPVFATIADGQGVGTIVDNDPTPTETTTAPVSSSTGGTASTGTAPTASDSVESEVSVPAGSASGDTTIIIEEFAADSPEVPAEPTGYQLAGQVINISTSTDVTFSPVNPAVLTLSYHDSVVPVGQNEATLPVLTAEAGTWTPVGEPCTGGTSGAPLQPDPCIAARDTTANTITIKTTHFSLWSIGIPTRPNGYRFVAADGGVFSYGDTAFYGSAGGLTLNSPIVGMAATPSEKGYWFVAADGGVFSYGDALFYGSTGALKLNSPIVGMAATPSGKGYWFVAADGGVFSYGDALFHGSAGALRLNSPIVGMTATPTGNGYWFAAADGGIFSYGDALFHGSTGALKLNSPIVGMAATPTGSGYWFVAKDGGIFSYGDAAFYGSTGAIRLNSPIVGMAA